MSSSSGSPESTLVGPDRHDGPRGRIARKPPGIPGRDVAGEGRYEVVANGRSRSGGGHGGRGAQLRMAADTAFELASTALGEALGTLVLARRQVRGCGCRSTSSGHVIWERGDDIAADAHQKRFDNGAVTPLLIDPRSMPARSIPLRRRLGRAQCVPHNVAAGSAAACSTRSSELPSSMTSIPRRIGVTC